MRRKEGLCPALPGSSQPEWFGEQRGGGGGAGGAGGALNTLMSAWASTQSIPTLPGGAVSSAARQEPTATEWSPPRL